MVTMPMMVAIATMMMLMPVITPVIPVPVVAKRVSRVVAIATIGVAVVKPVAWRTVPGLHNYGWCLNDHLRKRQRREWKTDTNVNPCPRNRSGTQKSRCEHC